jgi:hypothetical protein
MSRILRRPMFRGGPMKMEGIMSGIKDRQNYAIGTENPRVDTGRFKQLVEEIKPVIQESMTGYQKPTGFEDPIYQLAIQTGLDLMSKADSQNLLRNIGAAGARQTPQFFENLAKERAAKRQYESGIESAAVGLAGDILGREITATGKMDPIEALKFDTEFKRYSELGLPANTAENAANFIIKESSALRDKVGGFRYGGVLEFDVRDKDQLEAGKKTLRDGSYYYDPYENNYKYIRIIDGVPQTEEYDSIDQIIVRDNKADKEGPKPKDTSSEYFGMDIEDPIA